MTGRRRKKEPLGDIHSAWKSAVEYAEALRQIGTSGSHMLVEVMAEEKLLLLRRGDFAELHRHLRELRSFASDRRYEVTPVPEEWARYEGAVAGSEDALARWDRVCQALGVRAGASDTAIMAAVDQLRQEAFTDVLVEKAGFEVTGELLALEDGAGEPSR